MELQVETWDPSYGTSVEVSSTDRASESVELNEEFDISEWEPIKPTSVKKPETVFFIDGIRRYDANVWLQIDSKNYRGVCASIAAGAVRCDQNEALFENIRIERALYTSAEVTKNIELSRLGQSYEIRPTKDDSIETITLSIQNHLARLENLVSDSYKKEKLVIYDGPLNQRLTPGGVGLIKTQHIQYLPDDLLGVINRLKVGERTPYFKITSKISRWSSYVRLSESGNASNSIVRIELPDLEQSGNKIKKMFDLVSQILPKYASEAFKEPRAPQNLYPIAGLERKMRSMLGDREILERGLRMVKM